MRQLIAYMKKLRPLYVSLLFCICIICSSPAWAEGNYDGYIVKLRPESVITLMSAEDSVLEPVLPQEGLYTVAEEDLSLVSRIYPVDYIEPDYIVTLADTELPPSVDDVDFTSQWGLDMIDIPFAWQIGAAGQDVKIGVIDSGISKSHPALAGRVVSGYDYYNSRDDYDDTYAPQYHGTAVAGIIAANTVDGEYTGATRSKLYALKAFEGQNTSISKIIQAIRDAVDTFKCDIINMSFSISANDLIDNADSLRSLEEELEYAVEQGIILVAASGNSGDSQLHYPAAFDCVIGVGAVTSQKKRPAFSTYNESVFISAPGGTMKLLDGAGGYTENMGTSFAAPHVTAAAAILKGMMPDLTQAQFMEMLKSGAEDLGDPGYDTSFGWGLMNMSAMQGIYRTGVEVSDDGNVSFRLTNYTLEPCDGVSVVASYRDKTLIDYSQSDVSLAPGASAEIEALLSPFEDGVTAKGMLWDGIDTMAPIIPIEVLK